MNISRIPKASVGVISYNNENFIVECLNSIIAQQWDNLQIIISDDCSSDNSQKNIKNWMAYTNHKDIYFKQNSINLGITENLNSLLPLMSGDYFCFLGGDDIMLAGRIASQVEAMQADNSVSMCYSNMYWRWEKFKYLKFTHFNSFIKPPNSYEELVRENTLPSPTFMFKREVFNQLKFEKKYPHISDYVIALRLMKDTRIIYLKKNLILYRRHSTNITSKNYFSRERLKLNQELKISVPIVSKEAINQNYRVYLFAMTAHLIKHSGRKCLILKLLVRLFPSFFHSKKWFLRGLKLGFMMLVNFRV